MALASLCTIISPPAVPKEPGTPEGWRHVDDHIGLALPSDYKTYIDTFGTGQIASFFVPFNPFAASEGLNLLARMDSILEELRADNTYSLDEICSLAQPWTSSHSVDPGGAKKFAGNVPGGSLRALALMAPGINTCWKNPASFP